MRFKATAGESIPAGVYDATFTGIENFESETANDYGPAVKLSWKVTGGDLRGQYGSRVCSCKFGPKANLRKFAEAIRGSKIEPGEDFDFSGFFGTEGTIVCEETDSGATRVSTFVRKR
jgi:hypothetical protein